MILHLCLGGKVNANVCGPPCAHRIIPTIKPVHQPAKCLVPVALSLSFICRENIVLGTRCVNTVLPGSRTHCASQVCIAGLMRDRYIRTSGECLVEYRFLVLIVLILFPS